METFNQIKETIASMEDDMTKFTEKGNNAAAGRLRKALQSLKKLAQQMRVEIQEKKNAAKA